MSRFFRPQSFLRRRPFVSTSLALTSLGTYSFLTSGPSPHLNVDAESLYYSAQNALRMDSPPEGTLDRPSTMWTPPSREEMLQKLGAPAPASDREHDGKGGKDGLGSAASAKDKKSPVQGEGQQDPSGNAREPPSAKDGVKGVDAGKGDDEKDDGEFDLIIVGGGATGSGVALDAASRGLKVAMVERDDFSSGLFLFPPLPPSVKSADLRLCLFRVGTSSKSTKLVHGGVRYLQKAVFELDYEQYKLVKEALHERKTFLHTAPYLSHSLPIMLPIYTYWQIPYFFAFVSPLPFPSLGRSAS
jgi:glycerol-3-phosphate dehydrogenase